MTRAGLVSLAVAALLVAAVPAPAQAPAGASAADPACAGDSPGMGESTGQPAFMRADVRALGDMLTCYCGCPHLQVSKCFCGTADKIRGDFAARLDAGQTQEQIVAAYVAEHGADVMAVPPRRGFHRIIWVGPPALLIGGAILVWFFGRRWSRQPVAPELAPSPMDPEVEARYRDAVRRAVEDK